MKIFVSYSRTDAGTFAEKIHRDLTKKGHDVFIDKESIKTGTKWSESIKENISICDIFVVIVTPNASESKFIEREFLQAHNENKTIIPCYYKSIDRYSIGNLDDYQGIEFKDEYGLALNLYDKIEEYDQHQKNDTSKTTAPYINSNTKVKKSYPSSMQTKSINYISSIFLILTAVVFFYMYSYGGKVYEYFIISILYFALSVWIIVRASQISYVVSIFATSIVLLLMILITIFQGSGNLLKQGNLIWIIPSFITICILAAGLIKIKRY